MKTEFTLPVSPITKKNHSQIVKIPTKNGYSRLAIMPSSQYKKFEKECEKFVPRLGINFPINLKAVYYMPTRRKVDLCNLHEALCDVLVKYGCVTDDNSGIIATMDGSYVDYDKSFPRIDVFITEKGDI